MSLTDPLAIMQVRLLEHAMQSRGLMFCSPHGVDDGLTYIVFAAGSYCGRVSRIVKPGHWFPVGSLLSLSSSGRRSRLAAAVQFDMVRDLASPEMLEVINACCR